MEPTQFSIIEARYNKGQQISFFLLGTLILITLIGLLTVYINRNLGLEFDMKGIAFAVFFVLEYILSAIVFASKAKGSIDFDDETLKLHSKNERLQRIEYSDLKKINLGKGKKVHFLASTKTPQIYTVVLETQNNAPIKIKIENLVKNGQSLLPARIHEISEKFRIPLERSR